MMKSTATNSESTMHVNDEPVKEPEESVPEQVQNVPCSPPEKGNFVAAKYDRSWYIGKVLEVDGEDEDALISFMIKCAKDDSKFKWPTRKMNFG